MSKRIVEEGDASKGGLFDDIFKPPFIVSKRFLESPKDVPIIEPVEKRRLKSNILSKRFFEEEDGHHHKGHIMSKRIVEEGDASKGGLFDDIFRPPFIVSKRIVEEGDAGKGGLFDDIFKPPFIVSKRFLESPKDA